MPNYFRVIEDRGTTFLVSIDGLKIWTAEMSGTLKNSNDLAKPTVGDWVEGDPQPGDWVYIQRVVNRKNLLQRRAASETRRTQSAQQLAANVDYLWIVTSLNEDYSLNRVERYISMALSCQVEPVVILSKVDLAEDPVAFVDEAAARFPGIDIHGISCKLNWNLQSLDAYLLPDLTIALMGSSGVGKSTLVNHLLGHEVLATQEIQKDDSRGRHTTTSRSLHLLPQGTWLMDTPGLRALALWDGESGLQSLFADIEELASNCRFSDCSHHMEPGCAIKAALASTALSHERWKNYTKLMKEQAYRKRKDNPAEILKEKNRWKNIHLLARQIKKRREQS